MPRTFGDKYLLWLFDNKEGEVSLEVRLARESIKANIPMKYVAAALNVNHMTVYRWYRGSRIRSKERREVVEAFIRLLQKDTEEGILPVDSIKKAKHYIETMIGRGI